VKATIIALSLLAPASAFAGEPVLAPGNKMFEVGVATGAFLPASNHELYDSQTTRFAGYHNLGVSFQLRTAYFPLKFVGAEVEGGLSPQGNTREESAQIINGRGHLVLQLPFRVTPFVVGGGGFLASFQDGHGDLDPALHFGAGVKVYLTDLLSVRLDGRQIISAAQGAGAGNTNHFEVTAGLTFTLFREEEYVEPGFELVKAPEPKKVVAEVEPEPKKVEPTPVEVAAEMVVEALDQVYFAFDSAELGPPALPALDRAVKLLDTHQVLRVRIAGYADAIGTQRYNLALSRRRAQAIGGYLVDHGIARSRVQVEGKGEGSPVAPNTTADGRAKNRRVEFDVFPAEQPAKVAVGQPTDE
jgi:outer membrane protein OmpA-like peptidoglycan-associated protein